MNNHAMSEPNSSAEQGADSLVRAILMGVSFGEDDADDAERGPDGIDPAHMLLQPDTEPGEPDADDADWDE